MRIAFISDVHGNLTALNAVLSDLKEMKVDQIIHLGDAVTIGPQPIEALETLQRVTTVCIKGNHDAAVLEPEKAAYYQISNHLVPDLLWCKELLGDDEENAIDAFKDIHEVEFSKKVTVLCFHGSPASLTELIQATTPPSDLDRIFPDQKATVFIGGHSHIQLHRRHGNKLILNPGSVGNAFEYAFTPGVVPRLLPWAEYAILHSDADSFDVEMRRVPFEVDELIKQVKKSNMPGMPWWLRQYQ